MNTAPLRAALRDQGRSCADLGSPFTARLCGLLADRLQPGTPLTNRLFGWPGALGSRAASVPLRLCGAYALRLQGRGGLAMENDGAQPGAALTLRLWPHDRHIALGRVDFHGRWVIWSAGQ